MNKILAFFRHFSFPLTILAALLILVGTYEFGRTSVYKAHPELASTEQASAILAKVGTLIQLPNEQPTMATINDATGAKKAQPFLVNAANGDILIVYPNASEALLYRPSTNKLIAVGPVDNSAPQQTASSGAKPTLTTASSTSEQADNATTTKTKK